jgi:hypothetical protein
MTSSQHAVAFFLFIYKKIEQPCQYLCRYILQESNMPNHFILRIGDGAHFNASSSKSIWGIDSKVSSCKWFKSIAKAGDVLWFVTGKSKGLIVAMATFTETRERIIGPIIDITLTNKELGWVKTYGEWDTEVHYKDLYNLTKSKLHTEIKSPLTIREYNREKCKVDLPEEHPRIVRYSTTTNSM